VADENYKDLMLQVLRRAIDRVESGEVNGITLFQHRPHETNGLASFIGCDDNPIEHMAALESMMTALTDAVEENVIKALSGVTGKGSDSAN
jgi:hypothetical protein